MKLSMIIAIILAIGATAWIGSGFLLEPESNAAPLSGNGDEETAAERFSVRVADLTAEPYVEEVAVLGHTQANRMVQIAAEIDGTVVEILTEEGAVVTAGDVIARQALYDLQAQLDQAEALLEQRRIEYNAAAQLSQSGYSARTQVATTRANLNAAEAQVNAWQQELAKTEITAPFAGVIDSRAAELGSYLRIGDPVAMIVDLDPMVVIAHVTERQVGEVQVGAVAEARLVSGARIEGVIRYVSSMAEPATRTFRIEIEVDNAAGALIDGLTADVRIPGRQIMAHRISPAVIALADDGTIGVRTVDGDDVVRFMPISLLADTANGLWITGLPDAVTLITVGQEYVADGQVVSPAYQPSGPLYDSADTDS